jgi:predicted Rossmann fold flavoprotein
MAVQQKPVKLAIIGGGAAGMFAAAVAADRRLPCVVIERKARLGSKVLMTANGRCNFTKDISPDDFLRDLGPCASWVAPAVRACPPRQIIRGLSSLNVPLRRMADGRMFPADGKAATIVHAFGDLLRDEGIPLLTNCPVTRLSKENALFRIETQHFDISAENVLLATGGVSYPKTGSVGDGQNFARALGHRLVPYRAGLIGLETADRRITSLAGRRFEDARAKVFAPGGRQLFDWRGEVDCEKFGLSGAAIYNCQRFIAHEGLSDYELEVWLEHERLRFRNLRPRPLKEAIVTLGGVSRDDVDPGTMQSRLVPGLFFAGEILDIDGPTGGYNLTLAFATARKAVAAVSG